MSFVQKTGLSLAIATATAVLLSGCATTGPSETLLSSGLTAVSSPQSATQWYQLGASEADQRQQQTATTGKAKNVILVIGDGMGITSLTSGRIFSGQQLGLKGEEFHLSFESLPYSALVKTYNTDQQTPDSAGTMSAIMTGTKTRAGVIAVSPQAERANCGSSKGTELTSLIEFAHQQGKATGVVTTTRITHATPAATYAHGPERNWEADSQLPEEAKANGCTDIASQLVTSDLDVAFGGGLKAFTPAATGGYRADDQDLTANWLARPGHHFVSDAQQLQQANMKNGQWLGLFSGSHLPYVDERDDKIPGLLTMTQAAVERLSQDSDGYALVIEAGRIDHAHHAGNGYRALKETEELHQTLDWLINQVDLSNTLLLVTADHSHTLTLAGYPTRGNPINGVVKGNDDRGLPKTTPELLEDGQSYTSMNYRNGPGAVSMPRPGVDEATALQPDYQQQALIPLESETHGGEDVAIYGAGPYAHLLGGTMEQHWIYHLMRYAITGKQEI
ncbi:alkaline phosphatase [Oceanobacter mangrovi]|uniref:alkaline phosphatase n=1 Tax=Oceanobacter mangrovi TaxID=2862510 RepID=UPI001C8EA9A5|nr:alkaline phosphatase [Oceanobacter mangrovi]